MYLELLCLEGCCYLGVIFLLAPFRIAYNNSIVTLKIPVKHITWISR